uniref:Transporter n=1 Tax=Roseihalotalea indica TaxID=2867963 RepID=A0AA49JD66_9BACT|nr:transporter [Tunicatimonas sp. TK19036]
MKPIFFLCVFCLSAFQLWAQNEKEPLITDRPGEGTDAAFVVSPSTVQVEMGFLYQKDDAASQKLVLYPTALVRVGIIDRVELRASANIFEDGENSPTYISPLILGTKVHLTENQGWIPQASLLVNFTLADIGSEEVQTEYAQPQIKLLMNHTITEWLGLTTNLGIAWEGASYPVQSYAASFDITVNEYIGAFGEFYGFWSSMDASHLFNAGGTILLLPDFQIDLAGGVGISENAPDYYAGAGVSVRF